MARTSLLLAASAVLFAIATAKPYTFKMLDPNKTNPAEFWMPLWNNVPQEYCEYPRYPEVPTFGGIAMDILHDVYPNGTVPNVPAKPTDVWQKNLWGFEFDNFDYWGGIYPYPYAVSPKKSIILLMYAGAPVGDYGNRAMIEGFSEPEEITPGHPPINNASYPYLTMAGSWDLVVQITNGNSPRLANVSDTGAIIEYRDASQGNKTVAILYLVKGSPFINIECFGAVLEFGDDSFSPPVVGVDGLPPGTSVPGSHFRFHVAAGPVHPQGRSWHAYFSETVDLQVANPPTTPITVNSGAPYTGMLQIACGEIEDKMVGFLDKAAGTWARRANIKYDIEGHQGKVIFEFDKVGNGTLAMLAIPHQMRLMNKSVVSEKTAYWCVKGNMTAVHADSWTLTYNLTDVGFGDRLPVDPAMRDALRNATMEDYMLRINRCPGDNDTWGYPGAMNMELYAYARNLAQYTDIAIILENLGERDYAVTMTQKVLECIRPILKRPTEAPRECPPPINGSNICVRDQQDVYYDMHWGGLVTNWFNRFAAHYCQCDKPGGPDACKGLNYCDNPRGWSAFANYGNPFYNDHHFQYGYVVKSLSWMIYFQTVKGAKVGMNATTLHNVTKQALAFAREYANPDPVADPYFTYARHKDMYDGHSWAEGYDYSGRSLTWINQQSGGEAINSYYAVYLLGLALRDENVYQWGRIMLATESISIQQYQHLSNQTDDKKGQPTKEINRWGKCLSILFGNGASGATYYGPNALFQCGITLLPVTPYTREWLSVDWAKEAVGWIDWQRNTTGLCVFYDPETMSENPCPGPFEPSNWTGNEWACCPTNVGYKDNQWRAYPNWFPYLYVLQSEYDPTGAWNNLQYKNLYEPTAAQPFPYIASNGNIVGYQADITRSAALFHVATHRR